MNHQIPVLYHEGSSLLTEYGIGVSGENEALMKLGQMLVNWPVGEAMVLIAEQGRKFGVRLYRKPEFDVDKFLKDAERFGMTHWQAKHLVANLVDKTLIKNL